jgi:hypothetical protein
MREAKEDNGPIQCQVNECPYQKPHVHVSTNNGSYVKYIIEKPRSPRNWEMT